MSYKTQQHPRRWLPILITLAAMAGLFAGQTFGQRLSSVKRLNRFAQEGGNDAAGMMFKSGRDMVSNEQWSQAEQVFGRYVTTYPKEKNVDAALYWKAYAQAKLRQWEQARNTLEGLLKEYQETTWKEDARTLLAQLPGGYQRIEGQGRGVGAGIGKGRGGDPTADDDPCEFKIVVLQALMENDVQRGIAVASDWLKSGSTETLRCKAAALTLLARHGGKAATPTILGVAEHEADIKLRVRAISVLGATNDDSVIDALRGFALNGQQNEISEAALYALSQHTGPRAMTVLGEIATSNQPASLRKSAIAGIANRAGEPAVDELLRIYNSDQNLEIRKAVVVGLGHRRSERAGTKLLEIARSSDNLELRKTAIGSIVRRSGQQAIEPLLSIYDSEQNEDLKDQILGSLAYTNDPRVVRKLIEIARNPKEPIERRKRTIGWLSRSKDPEVLKLLEDLLKQ